MYINNPLNDHKLIATPRTFAYVTVALPLILGLYIEFLPLFFSYIVAYFFAFPVVTQFLSNKLCKQRSLSGQKSLTIIDAINIGALIAITGFPVAITMLLLILSLSTAIFQFGLAGFLMIMVPASITVALCFEFMVIDILSVTPASINYACIIAGLAYMSYLSALLRQRLIEYIQIRDQAIKQEKRFSQLSMSLSKYLSPQVWESIFSGNKTVQLENQRKRLTVFFSDIKGFTNLSEELEPEALTDILNTYLDAMSKVALKYGGTIDKFIGDSIMVFFGDPKTRGPRKDALAAVSMAIEMQKKMQVLRKYWTAKGIETPLEIRIGVNTGYCTVGNFGTNSRMDYTVLGREVNLASRLESAAKPNQILLSHETWSLVKDQILCRAMGEINVKGFSRPIPIYRVLDLRRNLGSRKTYFELEANGFSLNMDATRISDMDRKRVLIALDEAARELKGTL